MSFGPEHWSRVAVGGHNAKLTRTLIYIIRGLDRLSTQAPGGPCGISVNSRANMLRKLRDALRCCGTGAYQPLAHVE